MKIISYNISKCTQQKIDWIFRELPADVYIIPECEPWVKVPKGWLMNCCESKTKKTLAVVWKEEEFALEEMMKPLFADFFSLVQIGGIWILASWPTHTENNEGMTYPEIMFHTLEYYRPLLQGQKLVVMGDFNCFKGQKDSNAEFCIDSIADLLGGMGMKSAYHEMMGEAFGKESMPTFHWRFNEESRFHLDYAFTNLSVKNYRILPWNKNISDHHGIMLEV